MLAPPQRRAATRARQARWRARRRDGRASYHVDVDRDRLIEALLISGRLSDGASRRRCEIERELADVLMEWAALWLEKNS